MFTANCFKDEELATERLCALKRLSQALSELLVEKTRRNFWSKRTIILVVDTTQGINLYEPSLSKNKANWYRSPLVNRTHISSTDFTEYT
jgi:hypothetical protein